MQTSLRTLVAQETQLRELIATLSASSRPAVVSRIVGETEELFRDLSGSIEKELKNAKQKEDGELIRSVQTHQRELKNLKKSFRNALNKAENSQRKSLLRQRRPPPDPTQEFRAKREGEEEEEALRQGQEINNGFSRLRSQVLNLNQRAGDVNERLSETSDIIGSALKEHKAIEDELDTAKNITANLKLRATVDRLLIALAFIFYLFVCLYIIISRTHFPIRSLLSIPGYLLQMFLRLFTGGDADGGDVLVEGGRIMSHMESLLSQEDL